MSVAFLTRAATANELEQLRLVFSSFRDGGGQIGDGVSTLPGWRDFERSIAVVLGGVAPENKGVFDVIVRSTVNAAVDYGFSAKSKELKRRSAIGDLATTGRVYMELANSPAKVWEAVNAAGATEADFVAGRSADVIGDAVLASVQRWHREAADAHQVATGRRLDLASSAFLSVSYSGRRVGRERDYQIHAFPLEFPADVLWRYRSRRSLTADDPAFPGECLFDWYPFSGGQLKYYPRASTARYSSAVFNLELPPGTSLLQRAASYWPDEWRAAGGAVNVTAENVVQQLDSLSKLTDDEAVRRVLQEAMQRLRR